MSAKDFSRPDWAQLLVDAVTKPGVISTAYSTFWNYSVGNQILALFTCFARGIEPGPINTFGGWLKLGRHVRRGEKAITLCMPVTVGNPKSDDEADRAVDMAMEFASVPEDGQLKAWEETNGQPRHADHVRNIVAHAWVDAGNAMFDLSTLPEGAVSADLFSERTLVERSAFMAAQLQAMEREAVSLRESGWREVLVGKWEDLHDRPLGMDVPDREYDEATTRAIEKLEERRSRWEAKLEEVPDDDERALEKIQGKLDELETAEQELTAKAPSFFSEGTKSNGTVFLMLHPDGQVRREERIPRERRKGRTAATSNGNAGGSSPASTSLTSESLSERQLADLFTHQTLAVREALLKAPKIRKRVLALMLHPVIRSEALSIRHDVNAVTLHAQGEGFSSPAMEHLSSKRKSLDPFAKDHNADDSDAFEHLVGMSDGAINQLIEMLVVDCLTAHLQRQTALIGKLRDLLKVDLRRIWRPTAPWLSSYQKVQLAELLASLHGRAYNPYVKDERKKSQLVEELDRLFADAAAGTLDDKDVAARTNAWVMIQKRSPPP